MFVLVVVSGMVTYPYLVYVLARAEYRGLGLHESACAAAELRGSLRATSDGPGRGACFTLVLPHCHGAGPAPIDPATASS